MWITLTDCVVCVCVCARVCTCAMKKQEVIAIYVSNEEKCGDNRNDSP